MRERERKTSLKNDVDVAGEIEGVAATTKKKKKTPRALSLLLAATQDRKKHAGCLDLDTHKRVRRFLEDERHCVWWVFGCLGRETFAV